MMAMLAMLVDPDTERRIKERRRSWVRPKLLAPARSEHTVNACSVP